MKYRILLKLLHLLIGIKRFIWWLGPKIVYILAKFFGGVWQFFAFLNYKLEYYLRQVGWGKDQIWWLKRDNLQIILLLILLASALPQTKLFSKEINSRPGQKTMAYRLLGPGEDYGYEEIEAESVSSAAIATPAWRVGAVQSNETMSGVSQEEVLNTELGTIALSGGAVFKPAIMPGTAIVGPSRKSVVDYIVLPGDSLSSIAYRYDLSVATLMWENTLSAYSIIRPGDKLRIPPTTGVMHTIKKGDTLKKLASSYGAKVEDIVAFNNLDEDGTDLVIGEKIMVPGGTKVQAVPVRSQYTTVQSRYTSAAPAGSAQAPTTRGYVWPSAARTITQYYGWRHHGLDIAGPMGTAIYAAKGGTVVTSQCGWNSGYGCYVIIDHGNGVRTLYGHNSRLLVSVGDKVVAGQTISLMGNTGKVYGVTGIHLHFEIRINGATVNPLSYIR